MKLRLIVISVLLSLPISARCQRLEVFPSVVMTDETAAIRVTGLVPGEHIELHAELVDGESQLWGSEAGFVADAHGSVDLTKQAPEKGSYRIISAMGMIWSMHPESNSVHQYQPPHDLAPQATHFRLMRNRKEIANANLVQKPIQDGVRRLKLKGTLHGVLFLPASNGRYPGILVLSGAGGGAPMRRAALLASHGYAALALAYFHYENLPPTIGNIPLEYFGQALDWMSRYPEIDSDQLAVTGASMGGELALQLGAIYPQIHAVVALVPSNVRFVAFTGASLLPPWILHGQPLSYTRHGEEGDSAVIEHAGIPVEQTHGAVLVIGGGADGVWPSGKMVDLIATRLRQRHFAYNFVELKYPRAGHRAGMPEIMPEWNRGVVHPLTGGLMNFGGTPEGNAESSIDAIPKILDFLHNNLNTDIPAHTSRGR